MKWAVLLACVSLACAQPSRFDVQSRLVLVPVTVTDPKGRSVAGLEAADFRLLDDGRPRAVAVDTIDTGVAPIALVVAVESAGISAAAIEKIKRIASLIQPLVTGEHGCAALMSFDQRINWIEECTKDVDRIDVAFGRLKPVLRTGDEKEAHMLDAVAAAVAQLRKRPNSRRVLLLISELRDRGSETTLEAATVAAQSAGVTVYGATYSPFKTGFTSKQPVSNPPRGRPRTPNDGLGTVDGRPATKGNPKKVPAEQNVDLLGVFKELGRLNDPRAVEVLATRTGGATFSVYQGKSAGGSDSEVRRRTAQPVRVEFRARIRRAARIPRT